MGTAIIYVVLLLVAVVLYYLSKNTGKGAGTSGFLFWLRKGAILGNSRALNGTGMSARPSETPSYELADQDYDQVMKILDDIYKEVYEERDRFREQMLASMASMRVEFDERVKQLEQRMMTPSVSENSITTPAFLNANTSNSADEIVAAPEVIVESPKARPAEGSSQYDELYFKILDELHAGKPVDQIVMELGVSVSEVEMVKRLMSMHEQ